MIHVCLSARDDIFDGFGLKREIHDWLRENFGLAANDMTDFKWNKRGYYHRVSRNRMNPVYASTTRTEPDQSSPHFLHFLFKDPSHATMFKLTWGGQ